MGTNYYARFNICNCCNRFDKLHIGKASFGWTFSFQAIDKYNGIKIKSYKEWLKFLGKENVVIYDEYGEFVKLEAFMEIIIHKKKEKNNHAVIFPNHDSYLDKDGHSFTKGDFS